jgi:hypothetical protein
MIRRKFAERPIKKFQGDACALRTPQIGDLGQLPTRYCGQLNCYVPPWIIGSAIFKKRRLRLIRQCDGRVGWFI